MKCADCDGLGYYTQNCYFCAVPGDCGCPECSGAGKIFIDCDECGGTGKAPDDEEGANSNDPSNR